MIVYYTGTGNSRYCARYFADKLGDKTVDAFPYLRVKSKAELSSDTPWVFVAPTYGWQLPRIFESFLRRSSFSGNREAYFVMTCGSDIGAAGQHNRKLCADMGLVYRGTLRVVMPENYIAMFNAPEADEAERIIARAHPTMDCGVTAICTGRSFPVPREDMLGALKSGIVHKSFYHFCVSAKKFTVSDACISCGRCERGCPTGNIYLKDGKPVWGRDCTHCMACICGCPTGAIEYGKESLGKPRYQCPSYEKSGE